MKKILCLVAICLLTCGIASAQIGPGSGGSIIGGDSNRYCTSKIFMDNICAYFGSDSDFCLMYDETTDDALELGDGTNTLVRLKDDGTTGTWSIFDTLALGDGTDTHYIKAVQETGLGGRLSIGLDETARTLWIGDIGDIDTDHGLTANPHPRIVLWDSGAGGESWKLDYSSLYTSSPFGHYNRTLIWQLQGDLLVGDAYTFRSNTNVELTDTDHEQSWMYLEPKINQSGTAAYNALRIYVTETALGDGSTGTGATNNLIVAGTVGTPNMFRVDNSGNVYISGALTAYLEGSAPTAEHDITSDEAKGGYILMTVAADVNLPDVCDTATFASVKLVVRDAAETVSLTVSDTGDTIVYPGLALGANDELDSPGNALDEVTCVCAEADKWYCNGTAGWTDGGPAD